MDKISKEKRSENMKKIKSKNTSPEITVRKYLFSLGYRYRLHDKNLPGKPDLVFKSRKKVIFVHGCFWHQHNKDSCLDSHVPKSNTKFWQKKLDRNVERDQEHQRKLKELGWDVLVIWECEVKNLDKIADKIFSFLES